MNARPAVIAFDVVETLFSLEPLRERLRKHGQPGELLELWFARLLRDGFALAASATYRPFADVAREALHAVTGGRLDDAAADEVVAGFRELTAYPDAEQAMRRAQEAGIRIVTLTNGSAETARELLERAGLADYVDRAISAEEVRCWKPARAPYRHAATVCEVPPERMALVAAHSWDTHGAERAGLLAGWVSRLEGRYPRVFTPPDVSGADLVEVVDELLALPPAP